MSSPIDTSIRRQPAGPRLPEAWGIDVALGVLCIAAVALALSLGAAGADPQLVLTLRLPRVLVSAGVGALLALAGLAMQALLRNPLADPYVLGTSGGAAVGALIALLAGAALWIGAAAGALLASTLLLGLARSALLSTDDASPRLILTGAMLASVSGACATLLLTVVPDARLRGALFWLVGDLSGASNGGVCLAVAAVLAGVLIVRHRSLDRMLLGSEAAGLLGEPVARLRVELLLVSSVAAGLAVASAGAIGFVGLVVPQMLRLAGIGTTRRLAVNSAIGGATLLVLADLASRMVWAPLELPVGAIMALIGGPLFIVFLRRGGEGFVRTRVVGAADGVGLAGAADRGSDAGRGEAFNGNRVAPSARTMGLHEVVERQAVLGDPGPSRAETPVQAPLLEARGLGVSVADRLLVRSLDWRCKAGECWAIIGRNGAGKTRLLRALAGLDAPEVSGELLWQGRTAHSWAAADAALARAFMPQQRQDRFSMPVWRLLALSRPMSAREEASPGSEEQARVAALLDALGIRHLAGRDVLRLSGGERQRVALAQCMLQGAPMMLLDEPVSFQDPSHQWQVGLLLRRHAARGEAGIVLTAHDLNWVGRVATHVLALHADGSWSAGPADEMIDPAVLECVYECRWRRVGALVMPEVAEEERLAQMAKEPSLGA